MKYEEIKDTQVNPYTYSCFFAFGYKQFEEEKIKAGIPDEEKIYSAGFGLYGTKEGIQEYFKAIDNESYRIAQECDPQEVYDYEFDNHECGYKEDDAEAIKIVVGYFGKEKAKNVIRRYACMDIEELF